MSIGFVSTSILLESASSDGKFEEKRLGSEEVKLADRLVKEAAQKPLWEQLKEREDAKEEEFEAFRKAIYAPPTALDAEDAIFLEEARLKRDDALSMRREEDERALEAWKTAAQNRQSRAANLTVGVTAKSTEKAQQQNISSSSLKVVVNKCKRRKVERSDSGQGKAGTAAEGTKNPKSGPQSKSDTLPEAKVIINEPPETTAPSSGLANLLEGYSTSGSEAD